MKTVSAILLLVVGILVALVPAQAANISGDTVNIAELDRVIEAQMDKHGLPGVALAVFEGETIIYLKGYGSAGSNRPMTAQTPMFIGSQSKSFTALAIAQLAEAGKIDFDNPVQTYIPWFRVADETASRTITINHLLHHTSGLSDAGYAILLPNDATLEAAVRSLAHARLTAPVGNKHQYFNLGYAVLSYLIEQISGESYADYVQAHILKPLSMNDSTADPSSAIDIAQGYSRMFGFAIPMAQPVPAYAVGEGYIVSTAEDMAIYAIAIANDGAGLVSPLMMRRMLSPGLGSYGMGWLIVDNGTKLLHGGANETFRTEVNIYPPYKRGFVLLTNEGYQVDHFVSAGQLTSSVEAVVLGRTPPSREEGWSVRWMGWAMGLFVLGLIALHTRNFLGLRQWTSRTRSFSPVRRSLDVAISFVIPTLILLVVFSQIAAFYGDRFNLLTNLAYFRLGLPDVFVLMLIGTVPDYLQGLIKLWLWWRG